MILFVYFTCTDNPTEIQKHFFSKRLYFKQKQCLARSYFIMALNLSAWKNIICTLLNFFINLLSYLCGSRAAKVVGYAGSVGRFACF